MKFSDVDIILKEAQSYIGSTYGEHYGVADDGIQVIDYIHAMGDSEAFVRGNAIKYLTRFGKKGGRNRKDLLKVLHYTIYLMHFSEMNDLADNKLSNSDIK